MVRTLLLLALLMAALVVAGILFLEPADAPPTQGPSGLPQPVADPATDSRQGATREADSHPAATESSPRLAVDTPEPAQPAPSAAGNQAHPDGPALTVRVSHPDGRPAADAPLRLRIRGRSTWRSAWSGRTDAAGTLTLDAVHARCLAAHHDDTPLTEAAIGLDLLLAEPVFARFDPTTPPTEALEFVMPPTGKVTVIVDSLEQAESRVTLSRRSPLVELDPIAQDVYQITVEGRASFDAVGLGLGLDVAAAHPNANEATEVEADGPRAPGQEIEIRVRMFGDTPVLRARLVDDDSQPIAEASIQVVAEASRDNSSSQSYLSMRTDLDGVVLFEPNDDLGPDADRNMAFRAEDRDLQTAVDVPTPLRPGINDLGTLTMVPPPLLLAGRIVDARGEPIANAEVGLEGKVHSFYWDQIQGGEARSDGDGRFSIAGASESILLRARVEADGYVPTYSGEVPLGVRDLVVTLQQAGGLRGEVVLPTTDAPIHLQLEVLHGTTDVRTDAPSVGGSFRFPSLAPGTVALHLRLYGYPAPVATRPDLRIVGGETTDAGTIDLTDTLHTIGFTVVDPQGNPVSGAVALIESEPPHGHPRSNYEGLEAAHGAGRILATSETVDVFVYANGFRSTHHRGLRDGGEVVLPRAPEVVLQVADDAHPAATGHRLEARLTRLDDPWTTDVGYSVRSTRGSSSMRGSRPWDSRLRADADPQGAARLQPPEPGSYEVLWRLYTSGPDGTRTTDVGDPQRIEVGDSAAPQQIRASVTREQVQAALQGG